MAEGVSPGLADALPALPTQPSKPMTPFPLRRLREERHQTLNTVAALIGVHRSTLARFERGEQAASPIAQRRLVERLARAYKQPVASIQRLAEQTFATSVDAVIATVPARPPQTDQAAAMLPPPGGPVLADGQPRAHRLADAPVSPGVAAALAAIDQALATLRSTLQMPPTATHSPLPHIPATGSTEASSTADPLVGHSVWIRVTRGGPPERRGLIRAALHGRYYLVEQLDHPERARYVVSLEQMVQADWFFFAPQRLPPPLALDHDHAS